MCNTLASILQFIVKVKLELLIDELTGLSNLYTAW